MRPPVKPMATTISLVQKGHSSTPASGPKQKHPWVNLQEEEWRAMMVACTELGLPSGVWYFSRETLHNSSAIKSERNASLFLRSMTSAPRGKIQMRFYFILCRYAWSIQNKTPRSRHAIDNHRDHTNHWGGGVYFNHFIQKGIWIFTDDIYLFNYS